MSGSRAARFTHAPQTLSIAKHRDSLKHDRCQNFYPGTFTIKDYGTLMVTVDVVRPKEFVA
jgi:hypothetical protein